MLLYLSIFLTGSLFGTIFNLLSILFGNESLKKNRIDRLLSVIRCSVCGNKINPIYLIPILGLFLSKGKCNKCGTGIPKYYLLIEILYGALAIFLYLKFSFNLYAVIIFLILGLSISISIIDIRIQVIPNSLIIVFIIFSIYPVIINNSFRDNLYGLLLMGIFFIIVLLIFPGSFGGGDIKYASAIGILLGLKSSIVALQAALIAGSLIGIIYAIKSRNGLRTRIPFAPFLTFGLFISLLYGRDILYIYFRIIY